MPSQFRKKIELASFDNFSATGDVTTVLKLPKGEIIDCIKINDSAITLAQMTNLTYFIDNKPVMEYESGTLMQLINNFYNRTETSDFLTFHFERPEMKEGLEQLTSIGTRNIQNHRIEIDLASGLVGATLNAYAETRAYNGAEGNLGWITEIKKINYQASAGTNEIVDQIIRGNPIMAVHFYASDITQLQVKADSGDLVENLTKTVLDEFSNDWGRDTSGAIFSMDFCLRGSHNEALPTAFKDSRGKDLVQTLKWVIEKTAAAQVPIYVEYLRDTSRFGVG